MRVCKQDLLGSLRQAGSAILVLSLGGCVVPDTTGQREVSGSLSSASGWRIPFWGTTSGPVLAGGLLYAGSGDGAIYALDPGSGAIRWSFQTGEGLSTGPGVGPGQGLQGRRAVWATPVVENGTVLVGSRDFSFYAIDAVTGRKKWSFKTGGEIYDAAIIHGGNVLFTSSDGFLYAMDIGTGEKKWAFETLAEMRKRLPNEPIVDRGVVYLTNWAGSESYLYAIDAVSGSLKWVVRAYSGFPSPPRHFGGLIFFSTSVVGGDVILHAVDASSGQVKWRYRAEAKRPDSDPVISVGDMIIVGTDRGVFALHRETGALRWSHVVGSGERLGHVHADERLLYLPNETRDGDLHALDPATGKVVWSSSPGGSSFFGRVDRVVRKIAAIQGETIYATGYGYLHSLQRETGQVIWSLRVINGVHARPLIAGGMVFISGAGLLYHLNKPTLGYFYAIDAATGKLRP